MKTKAVRTTKGQTKQTKVTWKEVMDSFLRASRILADAKTSPDQHRELFPELYEDKSA